jgi:hypothetical protein
LVTFQMLSGSLWANIVPLFRPLRPARLSSNMTKVVLANRPKAGHRIVRNMTARESVHVITITFSARKTGYFYVSSPSLRVCLAVGWSASIQIRHIGRCPVFRPDCVRRYCPEPLDRELHGRQPTNDSGRADRYLYRRSREPGCGARRSNGDRDQSEHIQRPNSGGTEHASVRARSGEQSGHQQQHVHSIVSQWSDC